MKPTEKDKKEAIGKLNIQLRELPAYNAFGDNNHSGIKAQIELIEKGGGYDALVRKYGLTDMAESDFYTCSEWLKGNESKDNYFETLEL